MAFRWCFESDDGDQREAGSVVRWGGLQGMAMAMKVMRAVLVGDFRLLYCCW